MFRKIRNFFKQYKQLGFVVITIVIGAALDLAGKDTLAHWVLGLSALINIIPLAAGMLDALRTGKYGIDILAITAIVTAIILNEYWAAMVIVVMLTGGEALENYAESRAKKELSTLLARKPKTAHLIKNNQTVDIKISLVKPGDRLAILPGEVIPVDCVVLEGSTTLDESSLTGESLPVEIQPGDELLSGALNMDGSITVQALHSAADSQYEQIIKMVKTASSTESPFVRLTDRYSVPFTALSFFIAGSAWLVSGDAERFLEVIVVATPCPLLLGAPIALISGISRAAKHGIIVKTGSALERMAEVKTLAFDKTGTLTYGKPVVNEVTTYGKHTKTEVITLAAAMEQHSNHVLAGAIMAEADKLKIKLPKAKLAKEFMGRGISGRLQGKTILVGRQSLLREEGVTFPAGFKTVAKTATYVAVNDTLVGVIDFSDEVRPDSQQMLNRLYKLGIKHTLLVTGDVKATADSVAKRLGITEVRSECLPGDKLHAIADVKDRPVAFAGDGLNDAPVLTVSDVGIALGARGSTAASESADIVILDDHISKVADAFEIAKRTFSIARQSILIGILISIGLMGAFATGRFTAVQGAAIQELVDIIVIINALRAHHGKLSA